MTLEDVKVLLDAQLLWGEEIIHQKIETAFGCDLLSDMLAFAPEGVLLITGLTNEQLINTADIIGASGIVCVRGKIPSQAIIERAKAKRIPLFCTKKFLYDCCGVLYMNGLMGLTNSLRI